MWFNQYPYINLTDLNLDFIYKSIKELRYQLENFININTIKYANPIQWNITKQYEANTVVIDANDGTAYLSVKPVPSGVALTNTDYWTPIFTLNLLSANQNITLRDDGSNVLATFASAQGDWLIWNNTLYKVSQAINVNEAYVVGYNLDRYSVELFIKDYINNIITMIGDLDDLNTTDKTSIVNAINELVSALNTIDGKVGDLDDLTTTDKTSVVNAINELELNVNAFVTPEMFGAVGDGVTDDTAAFTSAAATLKTIVVSKHYLLTDDIVLNSDMLGTEGNQLDFVDCQLQPKSGVSIIGVNFTGGYSTVSTEPLIYISANNENITVDSCEFNNTKGMAIGIETSFNCTIRNCKFDVVGTVNKQVGIWIHGTSADVKYNHVIDGCVFHDIYLDGIGIYSAGYITVTNCKFDTIGKHPPYALGAIGACGVFVGDASHNSIVKGNTFYDCGEGAITVSDFSQGVICDNVISFCGLSGITFLGNNIICSNNKVHQCGTAETGDQYGINARSLERSVISNNICAMFSGNAQLYGIAVGTDVSGVANSVVISGNMLRYNVNAAIGFPNGQTDCLYNNLNIL